MEPTISIIIPVYNSEKYLAKCIDSVLTQTYPNYEVILVDDGSTDKSGKICDEYASRFDRIKVLHQENCGVAAARNNGVKKSVGELIAFVDSDDIVVAEYLSYMYDLMKKYEADMAVSGIKVIDEMDTIPQSKNEEQEECLSSENALIKCCYGYDICAGMCAKLYRRRMIEKYPSPPFKVSEDFYVVYHVIGDCQKIAVGSKTVYYYLQHEESTMHSTMSEKKLSDDVAVMNGFLKYVDANFPKVEHAARMRCARAMLQCMQMINNTPQDTRKYCEIVQAFLKPQMEAVRIDKVVPNGFKVRCRMTMTEYHVCKFSWSAIEKVSRIRKRMRCLANGRKGIKNE